MAINKVDLTVSQLINDLNNGLTWYKKDDLGYGNIESKYGATAAQIMAIRKHPKLKDAETNITVFNIIDDTKDEATNKASQPASSTPNNRLEQTEIPMVSERTEVDSTEAADVFANL
jgi:hypothetical protein